MKQTDISQTKSCSIVYSFLLRLYPFSLLKILLIYQELNQNLLTKPIHLKRVPWKFLSFCFSLQYISFLSRSSESFQVYVETMPWLCIPWQQAGVRAELAELYGIRGIPTLLLLDSNGHVITMDARTEIAEDPMAQVIAFL